MNPILGTLISAGAQAGAAAPALREQFRSKPSASAPDIPKYIEAAKQRVKDIDGLTDANRIKVNATTPKDLSDALNKFAVNPGVFGSQGRAYATPEAALTHDVSQFRGSHININPNSSREVLAHELGHHITDQTTVGRGIANMRHNPKLAAALGGAVFGLPFLQSALQEGDDDLSSGIAIAALASSPTLINEALATKNGLAIMESVGEKATMGQRGRLAGAYLSYAAAPIIAGFMGNAVGNVVDDYTAVYNLGQSTSELPM